MGIMADYNFLEPGCSRVHHHVPLPVSAADDGAGLAHRFLQMEAPAHGGGAFMASAAVLGAHLRAHLCRRVVTGIPMEFQFGTNWADFSKFSGEHHRPDAGNGGDVRLSPESAMVGAMVGGEKRLGRRNHFQATVGVALGSWLSGYFITTTNAFMQHPVGYSQRGRMARCSWPISPLFC